MPRRFATCAKLVFALTVLSFGSLAAAQVVPGCGTLRNAFGPFDYRDPAAWSDPDALHKVESFHYTEDVASLLHGNTGSLIEDLDYTLRAFPNHYRALQTLERYAFENGKFLPDRPAECYFKRAVAFRPDDAGARVIYGNYLLGCTSVKNPLTRLTLQCAGYDHPGFMDRRVLDAAKAQYNAALRIDPTSPDVNYSVALYYLAIGDLATAKRLAKVAYDAGYPLTGLKKKLEAAESRESAQHLSRADAK
ncbi:MAG: tetratricopeptide repeat protein [Steroidobacteraceae bacterium]